MAALLCLSDMEFLFGCGAADSAKGLDAAMADDAATADEPAQHTGIGAGTAASNAGSRDGSQSR